jgi:hypothetical protein
MLTRGELLSMFPQLCFALKSQNALLPIFKQRQKAQALPTSLTPFALATMLSLFLIGWRVFFSVTHGTNYSSLTIGALDLNTSQITLESVLPEACKVC